MRILFAERVYFCLPKLSLHNICGVPDLACDVNKLYYIYYLYLLSFFSATLDFCNVLVPVGVVHSNHDID